MNRAHKEVNDHICQRCGAPIAADSRGNWARVDTLSYRCLFVGEKHVPCEEELDPPEYIAYCERMMAELPPPMTHEGECELVTILDEQHCRKCIEASGKTLRQVHAEIMGRHINE